ncbi:hypothetical protein H5410_052037 [Solanum commersonii]|uniref:Uncharacterized protein n=1 Tax=Solanum commersonii TaxID=4109 RepID=A0A9J5X094_SOLCO|nr:hypothetical protein H5410_052037 [Solanum commersonii]
MTNRRTMFKFSRDTTSNASNTASTDVGSYVANINYIGLASAGTRDIWVHVISVSLDPYAPQGDYLSDAISLGSFHDATVKVLVCRHARSSSESKLEKSITVKETGGVSMIHIDEADKGVAIPFNIPTTTVSFPTTRILASKTVLGAQLSARVVAFSSRGSNS